MEILKAAFLGIIQGLTEFLPVSSSGHLIVLSEIMGYENGDGVFFELMLHIATLIPLLFIFFKDIIALFKPPFKNIRLLIVATIPAVIVMFLLREQVEVLKNLKFICFCFLFTAILLYITESIGKKETSNKPIDIKSAIIIGLAQAVAVIPGISRSGATISAGIINGNEKEKVAKFSFFMSIIIILGSSFLETLSIFNGDFSQNINLIELIVAMLAAAITGFIAIKVMLKVIQKSNYKLFSVYLVIMFVITFVYGYIIVI